MNVTAWSYSSDGQPYICVDQPLCEARIGKLRCVEVKGHDGAHRYPMSVRESMLWGEVTAVAENVIRAQVTLSAEGAPPQNDLDIVCAAAAGAYGPRMKDVAVNGLGFVAAHLRSLQQFDGSTATNDGGTASE